MSVAPGSGQDATVEDYITRLHPDATNIRFASAEQGFGAKGTYVYDLPGGGVGYTDPDVLAYQRNNGAPLDGRNYASDGFIGGGAGGAGAGDSMGTDVQRDALARIKGVLGQYGLDSLSDFVWQQILDGKSETEVLQDIRNHPTFKAEFPEIEARTKAKLAPLSPGEIVAYRQQARQVMKAAGLPAGFYDSKDDFTKLLTQDVSLSELNERVQQAKDATFNIPPQVRARLEQEFGVAPGSGTLTSFFLDPDKALPIITRDFNAARIGGRADMAGYAGLTNDTARTLADAGVSESAAAQGFGELTQQSELFGALDRGEDTIGQGEQLGAAFLSNGNAARRIEQRRRRRQAAFSGGGGFAETQKGVSGLQDPSRA